MNQIPRIAVIMATDVLMPRGVQPGMFVRVYDNPKSLSSYIIEFPDGVQQVFGAMLFSNYFDLYLGTTEVVPFTGHLTVVH